MRRHALTRRSAGASDPLSMASTFDHWRADTGTTRDGSDRVGSWAGRKNGYTVSQATTSLKPVWFASGTDSKPYLSFDGTDDFLVSTIGAFGGASGDYLIAVVSDQSVTPSGNQTFLDATTSPAAGRHLICASGWATSGKVSVYTDPPGAWREPANAISGPVLHLFDLRAGASAAGYYRNGTLTGALWTHTQQAFATGNQMAIGASTAGASLFGGKLYEVLVSRNATTAERASITAYFKARYPSIAIV